MSALRVAKALARRKKEPGRGMKIAAAGTRIKRTYVAFFFLVAFFFFVAFFFLQGGRKVGERARERVSE